MSRFKIGAKVYTMTSLDDVSLRDIVMFNTEAAALGLGKTWADVEQLAAEIQAADDDAAENHPDKMLMIGVTVWASRRVAGDDVTFGEAIDVPLSAIEFLPEPGDRKPGKAKAHKGQGKKKKPQSQGSPAASGPSPVAVVEPTTPATSTETSESAQSA